MKLLQEAAEVALSYAAEHLAEGLPAQLDPASVVEARRALDACDRFLTIHRPPEYEAYDPAVVLDGLSRELRDEQHIFEEMKPAECLGDAAQIAACLRECIETAALEGDAALVITTATDKDVPVVTLEFDGPGRVADPMMIGGFIPRPFDEIAARWTAATRGGRIDRAPHGLNLRLRGVRVLPPATAEPISPLLAYVQEARQALSSSSPAIPKAREAVAAALAHVDGDPSQRTPADLGTVVREAQEMCGARLTGAAVTVEVYVDPDLPPLVVFRPRILGFFANAFACAVEALPRGGSVTALIDYAAPTVDVEIAIEIAGTQCAAGDSCRFPSMRRAIADLHGGTIDIAAGDSAIRVTAAIPDVVGKDLQDWLPGYEAFTERSLQVLRLLRSGASHLPQEALLADVLEHELEHWLLEALSGPAVQNLAHDVETVEPALPGGNPARLKKALTQVKRGKPRKEICEPAYAGELLWVFRLDDRHRGAIQAGNLGQAELESLCRALLQGPSPDALACLRLLARRTSSGTLPCA